MTTHGLTVVFSWSFQPCDLGFSNWFESLMISAPDMVFPRMNNISF